MGEGDPNSCKKCVRVTSGRGSQAACLSHPRSSGMRPTLTWGLRTEPAASSLRTTLWRCLWSARARSCTGLLPSRRHTAQGGLTLGMVAPRQREDLSHQTETARSSQQRPGCGTRRIQGRIPVPLFPGCEILGKLLKPMDC